VIQRLAIRQRSQGWRLIGHVLLQPHQRLLRLPEQQATQRRSQRGTEFPGLRYGLVLKPKYMVKANTLQVMSDWGATHAGVGPILAGLDMDMPGGIAFTETAHSFFGGNLTAAVNNGSVPIERVDDMVRRIMTPYYRLGQDAATYPGIDPSSDALNFFRRKFACCTVFMMTLLTTSQPLNTCTTGLATPRAASMSAATTRS
jgi:hypothetical protein